MFLLPVRLPKQKEQSPVLGRAFYPAGEAVWCSGAERPLGQRSLQHLWHCHGQSLCPFFWQWSATVSTTPAWCPSFFLNCVSKCNQKGLITNSENKANDIVNNIKLRAALSVQDSERSLHSNSSESYKVRNHIGYEIQLSTWRSVQESKVIYSQQMLVQALLKWMEEGGASWVIFTSCISLINAYLNSLSFQGGIDLGRFPIHVWIF